MLLNTSHPALADLLYTSMGFPCDGTTLTHMPHARLPCQLLPPMPERSILSFICLKLQASSKVQSKVASVHEKHLRTFLLTSRAIGTLIVCDVTLMLRAHD